MIGTREAIDTFFARLGGGDSTQIAQCFRDEKIDWYVPGAETLPWTGRRSSRQEIADYFRLFSRVFEGGTEGTVIDKVVVDGAHAVVLGTFTRMIASSKQRFTTPVAIHLTVEDGLISRLHLYEDTLVVAKAFEAYRLD